MKVDNIGVPEGIAHEALGAAYLRLSPAERARIDNAVDRLRLKAQSRGKPLSQHGALEVLASIGVWMMTRRTC